MAQVLLVEDDTRLRTALRATFRTGGHDLLEAPNGEDALALVASESPDIVILDLKLPGMDGIETLHHLRLFSRAPVIVLTVRDELTDKVAALDGGADDYVVKPFEPDELLARVRAQLRRADALIAAPAVVHAGELVIDLARRQVIRNGAPVALTPLELGLLETLVASRGRLLTREQLLDAVWGPGSQDQRVRLRATMVSLRRKLGDDASNPRLIFTEPGLGYRWIAEAEERVDSWPSTASRSPSGGSEQP